MKIKQSDHIKIKLTYQEALILRFILTEALKNEEIHQNVREEAKKIITGIDSLK